MSEQQKPVEVPETTPVVTEPAADETKAVDQPAVADTPTAVQPSAVEPTPALETTAVESTPAVDETPAASDKKEDEPAPVEAGTLEHKGAPANFPKNLMYAKNHFWFGGDALEKDKLATYLKNEKATDVAHHVVSWATETGKGLLFYAKESDKNTPTGVIQLSEASEPATDGANKFHFTSKGHKHVFKAPTTLARDNWVKQLNLKIAEAKELATTVTESETYKSTLESLKPTKKEEKPSVAAAAAPVEEPTEAAKDENKKEEVNDDKEEKKEETKRRSASRKRASIFGNLLGGKKDEKKESPTEDKSNEPTSEVTPIEQIIAATEPTAETTEPTPATEAPAATEAAPTEGTKDVDTKTKDSAKPTPAKRQSIFGSLSFGKKKADPESAAPATPAKDETAPAETEAPVAETAPVIPAVETTEPLSAEVASPATVPTETTDATPAAPTESKKEVNDKRKSSLPFAFGKKTEKAPSDDETEKKSPTPFFSKLRQTVKKTTKTEKPAEKPAEETAAPAESSAADETPASAEAKKEDETAAAPAVEPTETPAVPATAAPVTAAPVTAAA